MLGWPLRGWQRASVLTRVAALPPTEAALPGSVSCRRCGARPAGHCTLLAGGGCAWLGSAAQAGRVGGSAGVLRGGPTDFPFSFLKAVVPQAASASGSRAAPTAAG